VLLPLLPSGHVYFLCQRNPAASLRSKMRVGVRVRIVWPGREGDRRNHGEQNRRSHAPAHSPPFTFMIAIVLVPFS
jgi:hypothetical protein